MKLLTFKNFGYLLLAIFLSIQFIRPDKNESSISESDISKGFPVDQKVSDILQKACRDCHSNNTNYPWYAEIQPVGWWLNSHIKDGKKRLNFSEFLNYKPYKQYHKLEEIDELVAEAAMPLSSYTIMHKEAVLSDDEKELVVSWTKVLRDSLNHRYHPDSLIMPSKRK